MSGDAPTPTVTSTAAPTDTPETVVPTIAPPAELDLSLRPILYLDTETLARRTSLITTGRFPDGRESGTIVESARVAWSPVEDVYAYVTRDRERLIVGDLQGNSRTLFESWIWEPIYQWPFWSPDGAQIAVITVGWCESDDNISAVVVIDVATGEVSSLHGRFEFWAAEGTFDGPTNLFTYPSNLRWSLDGQKILVSWDQTIVFNPVSREEYTISLDPVLAEWTPSGQGVYYLEIEGPERLSARAIGGLFLKKLGAQEPVELMDGEGLRDIGVMAGRNPTPGVMRLSPSGANLAVASSSKRGDLARVHVFDARGDETELLSRPFQVFETEGRIVDLEWSPGGFKLAAYVFALDGAAVVRILDPASEEWTDLADTDVQLTDLTTTGKKIGWAQ